MGSCSLQFGGTHAQGIDRPVHSGIRQPAGLRDALAKPDDPRKGIYDAKAPARGPGEQQATVVGTQVEGPIDGPAEIMARRACGWSRVWPGALPRTFGRRPALASLVAVLRLFRVTAHVLVPRAWSRPHGTAERDGADFPSGFDWLLLENHCSRCSFAVKKKPVPATDRSQWHNVY
jgi:hypothetical protein